MRYYLILFYILFVSNVKAQDGLEGIVLEKFYLVDKDDLRGSIHSGELPEGSVTYRIYVDLKPGFRFQAAFGSPQHPLTITSTEPFFNHIESGTTHPNILPERALNKDIALLDSWLSVGAAGENHLGILKMNDNDETDEFIHFETNYLRNKWAEHEYALTERDGMQRCVDLPFPTFYQMDSCLYHLGSSTNGNQLIINNGAWACMGKGAVGADSLTTNMVLIAQLTTAGELSYEINVLIGAPNGTSQKYVAKNPEFGEWVHKDLIYDSKNAHRKRKTKNKKH